VPTERGRTDGARRNDNPVRHCEARSAVAILAITKRTCADCPPARSDGLPDAVQLACALETGAQATVTHDRDFDGVEGLTILQG
jgi:predicted nucleic acid-binding protein